MYKDEKYRTIVNGKEPSLYRCYRNMLDRCNNPKHPSYHRYGGRGIKVEPYLQNWTNFADHMHEILPEGHTIEDMRRLGMSLDRIDTDGNYERGNIRWATQKEQILNRNMYKTNTSGYHGVSWNKKVGKWQAELRIDGEHLYLGAFDLPEKCFDLVQKEYLKHHGPEAHAKMMDRQRKRCEELGLKLKEYK